MGKDFGLFIGKIFFLAPPPFWCLRIVPITDLRWTFTRIVDELLEGSLDDGGRTLAILASHPIFIILLSAGY